MSDTQPDDTRPDAAGPDDTRRPSAEGYDVGALLGRGGMGEVLLAHDRRIGRDVAFKRMRAGSESELTARFVREAKIQARLDHPAIVPVYELGHDDVGRPYFTMKRLSGTTLQEVLRDPQVSQQRLLRTLVEVCLAIEFAHKHGVVHRDLKPSNIMLGEYGEVYVLDWGVARVLGDVDGAPSAAEIGTLGGQGATEIGSILGTPGYAAPEQIRGDRDIAAAADVYSLGAILFEILAGDSLHPRQAAQAIASTLASPSLSPAARAPDRGIAPELDAACVDALASDPAQRPSARSLADRVQRYLDGDRDLALRRQLAAAHLERAREAVAAERRHEAMQEAGKAFIIALESDEAKTLMTRLMVDPMRHVPPQLDARIARVERSIAIRETRKTALALCSYFLFIPFVIWVGIEDVLVVAAVFGFVAVQALFNLWIGRRATRPMLYLPHLANIVLAILLSRLFGPLMIVPAIAVSFSIVTVQQSMMIDRPWFVVAIGVAALLAPFALEAVGVLQSTWSIANDSLVIRSPAIHYEGARAAIYFIAVNAAVIVVTTLFGRAIAAQRRDAQQRLEVQLWHLRQFLPVDAPRSFVSGPVIIR